MGHLSHFFPIKELEEYKNHDNHGIPRTIICTVYLNAKVERKIHNYSINVL